MSSIKTVSQLNSYINRTLSNDFFLKNVEVRGEISGLTSYINGHLYFSIKDEKSSIPCVLFRNANKNINIKLENGLEVIVKGSVSMYEVSGKVQIIVRSISIGDYGVLHQTYIALKSKLEKMGFFDPFIKRSLPENITRLALVTSKSSAAVTDFLTVIKRRNPFIDVEIYDVRVQGNFCITDVISAIEEINNKGSYDLIAITRGGGSIEELFVFNDIDICTAIRKSEIPVATAIGHQRDVLLSELSSDAKSDTPTSLAELITERFYKNKILSYERYVDRLYEVSTRRIEDERQRLNLLLKNLISAEETRLAIAKNAINVMIDQLIRESVLYVQSIKKSIDLKGDLLRSFDYNNVLKRGYSVVFKDGKYTDVNCVEAGDIIEVVSHERKLKAEVLEVCNNE